MNVLLHAYPWRRKYRIEALRFVLLCFPELNINVLVLAYPRYVGNHVQSMVQSLLNPLAHPILG